MWFGGILTIIFWVTVILAVVWLVKGIRPGPGTSHGSVALSIARELYAKGEISHEEFAKIKKNLS